MKINGVEVVDNKCNVPLITFDVPTANGEIFSKIVVEKCIMRDKFINEKLKAGVFFGELQDPLDRQHLKNGNISRYMKINPDKIVMAVRGLYCTDTELRGDIELIEPLGSTLSQDIDCKTNYRIIHKQNKDENNCARAFLLITFDLMSYQDFNILPVSGEK